MPSLLDTDDLFFKGCFQMSTLGDAFNDAMKRRMQQNKQQGYQPQTDEEKKQAAQKAQNVLGYSKPADEADAG